MEVFVGYVSDLGTRQTGARSVVAWVASCDEPSLYLSVLTLGELQKGVSKLPDSNKPFLIVARLTCMRRGEFLALKKEDVDFSRGPHGIIMIRKSKSSTPKVIFMSELLSRYMRKLVLASPDEYVLRFNRSGDPQSQFDKLWTRRLLKHAGIPDLWFHDVRRTGSTVLYETTGDVYAAKDILGHSSVDVTERYLIISEESRQEAAEALASGQKIRQIVEFELGPSSQVQ
jgi:integrase